MTPEQLVRAVQAEEISFEDALLYHLLNNLGIAIEDPALFMALSISIGWANMARRIRSLTCPMVLLPWLRLSNGSICTHSWRPEMKKPALAFLVVGFLALGHFSASGQAPAQPRGVLGVLHAGQPVTIKEASGRYEIGVFENMPGMLGHKVLEVGSDYLVVEDIAGVAETRIPLYSIKAVVTVKIK